MSDRATVRLGGVWESCSGFVMALTSQHGEVTSLGDVERGVRAITKAERRALLTARGWARVSGKKAEIWIHAARPDVTFSLAAAIRIELMEQVMAPRRVY